MTISVADLKFFQSERMTDNSDGGGQMTDNEIVTGGTHQIFDGVTDTDRALGDVSIRKLYAAVTSANTDKYLDAGVALFKAPADPAVSVALFTTGDFYDERSDLRNRLEQTITRGARYAGWLYGQHLTGQRAILIWQRPEIAILAAGARLELVAKAGTVEQYSEYIWITSTTDEIRTMYESIGGSVVSYLIRVLTCEISEPLTADYAGLEPSRADPSVNTATSLIYQTRYNAEAVPLHGIAPLTASAAIGDLSLYIDSLYQPIIPTSLLEIPLADINPGGDSPTLVSGNDGTINFTTTLQVIKDGVALYLGTAAEPGTISIAVSGATLTDNNGVMKLVGASVGDVDYGNGIIRWNSSVPNYSTASKTITFQPAARPSRVSDTAAQLVTTENRGYVWTITLTPIPAPGTLKLSYQVNGVWYVLTDRGGGTLAGYDSSYGSGTLNFSTGTAIVTTGALPDVGSLLIWSWATPVGYTARGGTAVDAPVIRGQTAHPGLRPGYTTVAWLDGSLTDGASDGNLTGTGGVGFVDYITGIWWVRPTTVPASGVEFTIDYQYGTVGSASELKTETVPITFSGGVLSGTLSVGDIAAGSFSITFPAKWNFYDSMGRWVDSATRSVLDRDNGSGAMISHGGTVSYAAGTFSFNPSTTDTVRVPHYTTTAVGADETGPLYRVLYTGFTMEALASDGVGGLSVACSYRTSGTADWTVAQDVITATQLQLDLTKGFQETITAGSTRFQLGNSIYVETAGQIYRDPSPDTGAGTLAGTLDRSSGRVYLSQWTSGGANAVTLTSLTTEISGQPVDEVVFRTPAAPIRSGSLQLRYTTAEGTALSKTVSGTGLFEDTDCTIRVDHPDGVVRARFGLWRVDSALTTEEKAQDWYDPDHRVDFAGTLKIWKPTLVLADSILYNAVAQTTLPPDSAALGINAARLPVDGKALVFNVGRLALVHHTDSLAQSSLSPTQVIDCGRVRLYRVVIEDVAGQRLPESFFSVDRALGLVTMSPTLNLTGYAGPYAVLHTVADLCRITTTDISGKIALNKALSHVYPSDEALISSVLYAGTLQARVSNLFAQSTWTNVWSDTLIGSEPLAQYNDVQWPIVVSNLGAYQDRILIKFTSATAFQVIGENLGFIGIGDINNDCAPVNALTGQPYFTIPHQGWGSGWATGNCLRFNLVGAAYPVTALRAVQPSEPTGQDSDSVELILIGNVES